MRRLLLISFALAGISSAAVTGHKEAHCATTACTATASAVNMTGSTVIVLFSTIQGSSACASNVSDSLSNVYVPAAMSYAGGNPAYTAYYVCAFQSINPTVSSSMSFSATTAGPNQKLFVIGLSGTSTLSNAMDVWWGYNQNFTGTSWTVSQSPLPSLANEQCVGALSIGWGGGWTLSVTNGTLLDSQTTTTPSAGAWYLAETTPTAVTQTYNYSTTVSGATSADLRVCYKPSGSPGPTYTGVPNIIYDTDAGNDVDDAIAGSILVKLHQQGRIHLAGIISTTTVDKTPAYFNTMMAYAGLKQGQVSIGAYQAATMPPSGNTGTCGITDHYAASVVSAMGLVPNVGKASFPSGVNTYRKLLNDYPTGTIGIVVVGPLTNLADFMTSLSNNSGTPHGSVADNIPLTGAQLLAKAQWIVFGAGQMPTGNDGYNTVCDVTSLTTVLANNGTVPFIDMPYNWSPTYGINYDSLPHGTTPNATTNPGAAALYYYNTSVWRSKTATISAATNASPIVVTSSGATWASTDQVYVSGVLGNTATNGIWPAVTSASSTGFTITGSTGNGVYTSGGTATTGTGRNWDPELALWAWVLSTPQAGGPYHSLSANGQITFTGTSPVVMTWSGATQANHYYAEPTRITSEMQLAANALFYSDFADTQKSAHVAPLVGQ